MNGTWIRSNQADVETSFVVICIESEVTESDGVTNNGLFHFQHYVLRTGQELLPVIAPEINTFWNLNGRNCVKWCKIASTWTWTTFLLSWLHLKYWLAWLIQQYTHAELPERSVIHAEIRLQHSDVHFKVILKVPVAAEYKIYYICCPFYCKKILSVWTCIFWWLTYVESAN